MISDIMLDMMPDIIFGYYIYIVIFGFIGAFIFHPPIYSHKILRRLIFIINSFNVLFYMTITMIYITKRIPPTAILDAIWKGDVIW